MTHLFSAFHWLFCLGIHISFWPIRAWYNPDGITFHQWQGRKLLFTANEGDGKDYDTPAFDEAVRGAEIAVSGEFV